VVKSLESVVLEMASDVPLTALSVSVCAVLMADGVDTTLALLVVVMREAVSRLSVTVLATVRDDCAVMSPATVSVADPLSVTDCAVDTLLGVASCDRLLVVTMRSAVNHGKTDPLDNGFT
jgi:hypothetical protein